jgi:hypothetical protein
MTKLFHPSQPTIVRTLLLPALFSLLVVPIVAAQDVLNKVEDVVIDEPKDFVEDVFDHDQKDDLKSDPGRVIREKTSDQSRSCGSMWAETITRGMSQPAETVKLDTLIDHKEEYYGKTVTVEGELHRFFADGVFTIEDDDFFSDDDLLVINTVGSTNSVEALDGLLESGKDVRVTGVIRPYDQGELECEYGPLNLESREGHSFTKAPVLVIGKPEVTARIDLITPPVLEKPEPPAMEYKAPEPPAPTEMPLPEPARELPKTNSVLPLTALMGLLSVFGACLCRYSAGSHDR